LLVLVFLAKINSTRCILPRYYDLNVNIGTFLRYLSSFDHKVIGNGTKIANIVSAIRSNMLNRCIQCRIQETDRAPAVVGRITNESWTRVGSITSTVGSGRVGSRFSAYLVGRVESNCVVSLGDTERSAKCYWKVYI